LAWLATFYVELDDFEAAHRALNEVLAIRIKLHGEQDYRSADARHALAEAELRSQLSQADRKELIEADHESLAAADRSIPAAESLKSATRSYEIRRRLLGPEHPLVARSLRWQGLAYQRLGQLDRAESSLRESMAVSTRARPARAGLASGAIARRRRASGPSYVFDARTRNRLSLT
jgi:tetratricopeptide (TPR) repeat protein